MVHGGDIYSYQQAHQGVMPLDFSANINPYGTPTSVMQAMYASLPKCCHYPDPLCRALRQAIGEAEGISPERVFCGNGAAEVLFRVATVLQPRKALLTAPAFAEYEQSLRGSTLQFHTLTEEDGFRVTDRILEDITAELDAVYLCNPNNPTGCIIAPELLQQIIRRCEQLHIWLIVDECFCDFLLDSEQHVLTTCPQKHIIQLRAFTKMYAIPGVRLGYCIARDETLITRLSEVGQPWNVSVIAQACGVAASKETAFARWTAEKISEERNFLREQLKKRGFKVFDGEANFLLFFTPMDMLGQKLLQRGILVRDCSNYRGLAKGFYRIAIRQRTDHVQLLQALDEIGREQNHE